jgi:quercetin dioxygenase-like cupin family protein
MRTRRNILIAPALILALGALIVLSFGAVAAQGSALTTNIKQETLGSSASAVAPGRQLLLNRRTFAPGADSGAHPAAGPVVLYVESGAVEFKVVEGAALVTTAGAKEATTLAAGKSVILKEGDVVTYDEGVVHDVYNEGRVPAVTLESRLNPEPTS